MGKKKVTLGIVAGVAALAVVGIILKRKGYLENLGEKADNFGGDLKDKLAKLKQGAQDKFDELKQKGEDLAHSAHDKFDQAKDKMSQNNSTSEDIAGNNLGTAGAGKSKTTGTNPATV